MFRKMIRFARGSKWADFAAKGSTAATAGASLALSIRDRIPENKVDPVTKEPSAERREILLESTLEFFMA
jgi:hypothetical protein